MKKNSIIPVSVVVPCFNCAKTIERAVQSVLDQVVLPFEIILVDDASEDATLTILNGIQQNNPSQIKVVRLHSNKGAGSARNAGWEVATQDYIAFLDSDDSWHPDKLRIQYEFMKKHQEVSLSGHLCEFVRDVRVIPEPRIKTIITEIDFIGLLFKNAFSTPTVMVKRDILIRFQEGKRVAEDVLLWQQIAFQKLRIARLESILAYVHKPLYGESGLSASLWKMEVGELSNFATLYRSKCIGIFQYIAVTIFSIIKFIIRLFIVKLRKNYFGKGV